MEIKKEIINQQKELTAEERKDFATKIGEYFEKWDEDREKQITTAKEIMEEVYLNQPKKSYGKGFEWKSDVKLNGLYNIKSAQMSVMWRELYANASQMFDVQGTNKQTEEMAKQQKAAIVDSLNKMEIGKVYDNAMNNWYDYGEFIFKTDWEQKKKVVKRQKKGFGWILQSIAQNINGAGFVQKEFKDVEIPYYENARVESVSSAMFVFDHSKFKPRNKESWDSIIKIYKRFETYENIKNNGVYKLSSTELEELKELAKDDNKSDNKKEVELREKTYYGGKISVLYAHGDFKINGKFYKNYIAEIVGGKFLARFEENPIFINPFILCAVDYDPITKRGISPLKVSIEMCKKEEELTNLAFDIQKLTANPPCWVDEDLLNETNTDKDGNIRLAPGKYIQYKSGFNGGFPQPYTISSNGISDLIGLLNQKIAEVSNVSSVNYGTIESQKRTATELSLADKGSTAQSGKIMDIINQDLTIPMIKNVAELLAMFKDGTDYVYAQEKGKNIEYKITNEIRQAEYNYTYEDRNAMNDRKSKFQDMYQLFSGLAQLPEMQGRIDWENVSKEGLENIGYDNLDKFFKNPTPATQLGDELNKLPQEVQEQLISQFAQVTQETMQQYTMQQQQAQMQEQANKQVQMDLMRQQARNNAEMQMANDMGLENGII